MKAKNIYLKGALATLTLLLVMGSCSKRFLEEPKPATSISSTDVYATPEGVRSYFNGLYRELRTQWGGDNTDAWGIISVNLAREVKGLDVGLPDGGWYNFDYEHDNREPNYRRTVFTWEFFFNFVNKINNLIDGVENSSLPDATKAELLGEGRAFRGWVYYELAREFAPAYASNPNGPGLPIYLAPTAADTEGQPRQSISAVYDQILEDLEYAVANVPVARANNGLKDVINRNVVNGLLARVYLELGTAGDTDYLTKAVNAAIAARNGFPLDNSIHATAITGDFESKSEVIWGFPQASDQSVYYGSPSAFFGTGGVGYFNFFIDPEFVALFSPTDVRTAMFVSPSGPTYVGIREWKTNKFGETTNFADFVPVMRTPEMILIEAEAKARLGSADAGTVLFNFQSFRDPNAVSSGNTGEALIDEILLEKRKELLGEIGIGFLDLKRTGNPLVRGAGHIAANQVSIPANDPRFTLKIPEREFDSNPAMDPATDQNP